MKMTDPVRNTTKRRLLSVSPPAAKRKQIQSTTTKVAVSSFFVPASQKPPEPLKWQQRGVDEGSPDSLLIATYTPSTSLKIEEPSHKSKKTKIAAFDFDSTLVSTQSGNRFAKDAQDWKWWHPSVPTILKKLHVEDGFRVVIISNQAGLSLKTDSKTVTGKMSQVANFKGRIIGVTKQVDIPMKVYAATEKDIYRKPRPGIWKELLDDFSLIASDIDFEASVFVGDAAGRVAEGKLQKDFSCSDRNFAENVGIAFKTPEEFFLQESPRKFSRDFDPATTAITNTAVELDYAAELISRTNTKDIVVLCGSPGAGKSTTYWKFLKPLGYERVNQDLLKTPERCLKAAEAYLKDDKSVVVDNTNADIQARKRWIGLATKYKVPVRCIHLTTDANTCAHNNVVRALNAAMNPEQRAILPEMAFNGFKSRFQEPKLEEGFQDIIKVDFKFHGTDVERAIWSRYWI